MVNACLCKTGGKLVIQKCFKGAIMDFFGGKDTMMDWLEAFD